MKRVRSKKVKDICVGDILRYSQGEFLVVDIEIINTYFVFRGLCRNGSIGSLGLYGLTELMKIL